MSEEATHFPLICNESFLWIKKQLTISLSMESLRLFRLQCAQQDLKWGLQIFEHSWLQQGLPSLGIYDGRLKVRQWMLNTIPRFVKIHSKIGT